MNKKGKQLDRKLESTLKTSHSNLNLEAISHIEDYLRILKNNLIEEQKHLTIPLAIFEKGCSSFESIVRYLIEEKELTYIETAKLLKRKTSTIGVTYKNAKRKTRIDLRKHEAGKRFSAEIFSKSQTIIQAIISMLQKQGYTTKQIADILHRHYNTIYTIQNRGNK